VAASRSGASSGGLVVSIDDNSIRGIREFRRALKGVGPEWARELRVVHKRIADMVVPHAQARAQAMGGVQAEAAGAIKGKANQREARIGVGPTAAVPFANVAFWGAKKRTGWYARYRYKDSPAPQHPAWVGNSWDVGEPGGGPYAINPAIADDREEVLAEYLRMIDELAERAGFTSTAGNVRSLRTLNQ